MTDYSIDIIKDTSYTIELNEQGPQGIQGPKGIQGEVGPVGPKGDIGDVGPKGDKGDKGEQGDIGPVGPQGEQGIQGEAATITIGKVETLPADSKATVENVGTQGSAIFDFGIPQGVQGIQGERGLQGPQGIQGPKGEQGDIGPQGPQGLKGDKGDKGPQGPQGIQGETGPIGPQGEQGATGPRGPQGATGPVGPQGPQGLKGDQGPQGEIGPAGPKGEQGIQGPQGVQGPRGLQGVKGDTGFSPTITEKVNTQNEYILTVINDTDTYDTPNLKAQAVIPYATQAEAEAGVATNKVMSPSTSKAVAYKYIGKVNQLGFNGVLQSGVITFTPDNNNVYEIKDGYEYEIDLLFEAVGTIDDDTKIVIKNGTTNINIVNALYSDYTKSITYKDLKQVCKYDTNIGYRFIFNGRYTTKDNYNFIVIPSTVNTTPSIYNSIQDCIVSNPNLIQYEQTSSTIILKKGSKLIIPNGVGNFTYTTLINNISSPIPTGNGEKIMYTDGGDIHYIDSGAVFAGATKPTGYTAMVWYDTTENKIKYSENSGATWTGLYAFPIARCDNTGIKECFCTGISHFANCVWVANGVEVLIPNGKDSSGKYNNSLYHNDITRVAVYNDTYEGVLLLGPSGLIRKSSYEARSDNYVYDGEGNKLNACPISTIKTTTGVVDEQEDRPVLRLLTSEDKTKSTGSGLELCDIGCALYIDETKGLRRRLNGSIMDITSNYQAFLTRLKEITTLYPSLVCTETEWQAIKTASKLGQCGKFVLNYRTITETWAVFGYPLDAMHVVAKKSATDVAVGDTVWEYDDSNNTVGTTTYTVTNVVIGSSGTADVTITINDSASTTLKHRADGTYDYTATVAGDVESVRLPAVVNIQGLTDLSKLGITIGAGLPSIAHTHKLSLAGRAGNNAGVNRKPSWCYDDWSGAVTEATTAGNTPVSSIYGNSNTVQQEAIQYPYFIQVATGQETENNIVNDIELNNPSFFGDSKYVPTEVNNLSWLKSNGQNNPKGTYPSFYNWVLENVNAGKAGFKLSTASDITDYDFVINTTSETFRLPLLNGAEDLPSNRYINSIVSNSITTAEQNYTVKANGWVYVKGNQGAGGSILAYIKTPTNVETSALGAATSVNSSFKRFVKPGDVLVVKSDGATFIHIVSYFQYAQGNGNLYYYVGETVQNANLIDAGRIGEILPTKTDMLQASGAGMPSSKYIDLAVGANGAPYTAPANGWFCASGVGTSADTSLYFITDATGICSGFTTGNGGQATPKVTTPVSSGDVVRLYHAKINTWDWFRFVYAEGSKQ